MSERGSRLQKSVVTFGPAGRAAATVVVLLPLVWMAMAGAAGLIGFALWLGWVVPRAVRDIWRRAELPTSHFARIQRELRLEGELADKWTDPAVPSITQRRGTPRW